MARSTIPDRNTRTMGPPITVSDDELIRQIQSISTERYSVPSDHITIDDARLLFPVIPLNTIRRWLQDAARLNGWTQVRVVKDHAAKIFPKREALAYILSKISKR